MTDVVFAFGPVDSYFFESQTCWAFKSLPPRLQLKFMNGSTDVAHVYQLVLGAADSWFISYRTKIGGYSFSHDGLPEKLAAWLRMKDQNGYTVRNIPKLKISLGPGNMSFWAEDGRDYYWDNLPTPLEMALQKLIGSSGGWTKAPRIVVLGCYQSYVLITEGGGGSYAVSDYYPLLQRELALLVESKKPGVLKTIHHISLDQHDKDNFVMTMVNGDIFYYIPDALDQDMERVKRSIPRTPLGAPTSYHEAETVRAPMPVPQTVSVADGPLASSTPETAYANNGLPSNTHTGFVQVSTPVAQTFRPMSVQQGHVQAQTPLPGQQVQVPAPSYNEATRSMPIQYVQTQSKVQQQPQQQQQPAGFVGVLGQVNATAQRPMSPPSAYQHPHVANLENAANTMLITSPATVKTVGTTESGISAARPNAASPALAAGQNIQATAAAAAAAAAAAPPVSLNSPVQSFSSAPSGRMSVPPQHHHTSSNHSVSGLSQGISSPSPVLQYVQDQQALYEASLRSSSPRPVSTAPPSSVSVQEASQHLQSPVSLAPIPQASVSPASVAAAAPVAGTSPDQAAWAPETVAPPVASVQESYISTHPQPMVTQPVSELDATPIHAISSPDVASPKPQHRIPSAQTTTPQNGQVHAQHALNAQALQQLSLSNAANQQSPAPVAQQQQQVQGVSHQHQVPSNQPLPIQHQQTVQHTTSPLHQQAAQPVQQHQAIQSTTSPVHQQVQPQHLQQHPQQHQISPVQHQQTLQHAQQQHVQHIQHAQQPSQYPASANHPHSPPPQSVQQFPQQRPAQHPASPVQSQSPQLAQHQQNQHVQNLQQAVQQRIPTPQHASIPYMPPAGSESPSSPRPSAIGAPLTHAQTAPQTTASVPGVQAHSARPGHPNRMSTTGSMPVAATNASQSPPLASPNAAGARPNSVAGSSTKSMFKGIGKGFKKGFLGGNNKPTGQPHPNSHSTGQTVGKVGAQVAAVGVVEGISAASPIAGLVAKATLHTIKAVGNANAKKQAQALAQAQLQGQAQNQVQVQAQVQHAHHPGQGQVIRRKPPQVQQGYQPVQQIQQPQYTPQLVQQVYNQNGQTYAYNVNQQPQYVQQYPGVLDNGNKNDVNVTIVQTNSPTQVEYVGVNQVEVVDVNQVNVVDVNQVNVVDVNQTSVIDVNQVGVNYVDVQQVGYVNQVDVVDVNQTTYVDVNQVGVVDVNQVEVVDVNQTTVMDVNQVGVVDVNQTTVMDVNTYEYVDTTGGADLSALQAQDQMAQLGQENSLGLIDGTSFDYDDSSSLF